MAIVLPGTARDSSFFITSFWYARESEERPHIVFLENDASTALKTIAQSSLCLGGSPKGGTAKKSGFFGRYQELPDRKANCLGYPVFS